MRNVEYLNQKTVRGEQTASAMDTAAWTAGSQPRLEISSQACQLQTDAQLANKSDAL